MAALRPLKSSPGSSNRLGAALLALSLGAWLGLATQPLPARADEPVDEAQALDNITKLNKKALEQYDNLNFDEAQETLISALELCTTSGLDDHPIKARTYLHLGVVVLAGGPLQREEAFKQFKKALAIQPDIVLTDRVANPDVQQAFQEAKAAFLKERKAQAGNEKVPSEGLSHAPITTGVRATALQVAVMTETALGARKVVVSFRAPGASDFSVRELSEISPGVWSGAIPETATAGNQVAYTIRALNAAGEAIAGLGTLASPLVVNLTAGQPGRPPIVPGGSPEGGEDTQDEAPSSRPRRPIEPPDWFLGLGVGTGYGWTSGFGDVNNTTKVTSQFGLARLGHALPEVGYFMSPELLLSLQVRWQAVSGATPIRDPTQTLCGPSHICEPARGALAAFGRLAWIFRDERIFRPYVAALAGAGQIRHLASFPNAVTCGTDPKKKIKCVDTVAAGPIFVGPGAGFFINLTRSFAFTLGANALLGFSVFTFNVDLNAGIAIEL